MVRAEMWCLMRRLNFLIWVYKVVSKRLELRYHDLDELSFSRNLTRIGGMGCVYALVVGLPFVGGGVCLALRLSTLVVLGLNIV